MLLKKVVMIYLCCITPFLAQASLHDRGNGLIYDDVLNVTWLQDANYAKTSGYDADGQMTWNDAQTWVSGLTYGGYSDWRLSDVNPVNTVLSYDGTSDVGYNITSVNSELAYMFYVNLGNSALYDTAGNPTGGCSTPATCLTNTGLFNNLQSFVYWSGVELASDAAKAWSFNNQEGLQNFDSKGAQFFAWAVRSGDITPVPVPAAIWLFVSGFVGLFGFRQQQQH